MPCRQANDSAVAQQGLYAQAPDVYGGSGKDDIEVAQAQR
jgi:hypothetical protein